ncbi:MAG: right-handed parallel beta-helix repeat-containing protein [Chitinivibrionales bacterium]|nr:right-handed parallel beta-helix repeat-containing protein [Chitinivibrionales bacterium]
MNTIHSMKYLLISFCWFFAVMAQDSLPVFPGAEGFGVFTPAGRGGEIIKVTNLNADGPGSLRDACGKSGPRIIVFEVAGVIDVAEHIQIRNPFCTLAGQTAPSPGITVIGAGLRVYTNDVLIQHMKVRPGGRVEGPRGNSRQGICMVGSSQNVVIDHCSVSWATDENMTCWSTENRNITFSNCINSECLNNSVHPEGPHSKGMLVGFLTQNVSVIRNLFAHNGDRNPLIKGGCPATVVNNFVYNPIGVAMDFGEATFFGDQPQRVSVIGNVLKATRQTNLSPGGSFLYVHVHMSESRLYMDDNVTDGSFGLCSQRSFDPGVIVDTPEEATWTQPLTALPSAQVMHHVLSNAGARPQDRDEIDRRIINDAINGTGRMIDSQDDVGGFPQHAEVTRTLDIPADPNGDDDSDGYTNAEEWLHQMAAELEGPVDIPLDAGTNRSRQTMRKLFFTRNGARLGTLKLVSGREIASVKIFSCAGKLLQSAATPDGMTTRIELQSRIPAKGHYIIKIHYVKSGHTSRQILL